MQGWFDLPDAQDDDLSDAWLDQVFSPFTSGIQGVFVGVAMVTGLWSESVAEIPAPDTSYGYTVNRNRLSTHRGPRLEERQGQMPSIQNVEMYRAAGKYFRQNTALENRLG